MSRVLGLDYGERRIGLALSDPLGIIAKPLSFIDRKKTADHISRISEIIEEIKKINLNKMTPIGALNKLNEIKKKYDI